VIRRLEKDGKCCIKTIIPGQLHRVSSHAEEFQLQLQRQAEEGEFAGHTTFKFVAKNGKTRQDVAIVARHGVTVEQLCAAIHRAVDTSREKTRTDEKKAGGYSLMQRNTNASDAKKTSLEWKDAAKEKSSQQKAARREARGAALRHKQAKKLSSSKAAKEGVSLSSLAARDAAIVYKLGASKQEKVRGKHAMK
jgi:hypothetical protein